MNLKVKYYGFGKALAACLGMGAEIWVVTTACSSTTAAIGLAQTLINRGYYKKVLVGGSDSLCLANMSGFNGLKALSSQKTAPFSLPVGLNTGEAACFWMVEEMEQALLRRARCYGKIIGHATTSDAYHPTTPDPRGDGVYRTLSRALASSGISLTDIGYINAHGTGTEANDCAESKGIARFIQDQPVPVVSLKSFFGHCMGAAGILEATCSVLAMRKGFIPPTINFSCVRPGCSLDYVPNVPRQKEHKAFISANYAFGGNNAACVISDWDVKTPEVRNETKRIVITGTGVITALGLSTEQTLAALREGRCGISSVERLGLPEVKSTLAGLVPVYKASDIDRRLDFSSLNPISKYATSAAKRALDSAGIRVSRSNAEHIGIAMGVCNGPSEAGHMERLFSSDTYAPDINSFSNVTANSTAGSVSKSLYVKGANISLASGQHAGLQALAYAYDALCEGQADYMLAGASDEIYPRYYWKYNIMNFLYTDDEEKDYRLRLDNRKQKVLGEGAGMLILETEQTARKRNAPILGEVLGYGMSMDAGPFYEQNLGTEGLQHASRLALQRSRVDTSCIDLVAWAPQGNMQDKKVIDVCAAMFGKRCSDIPMVTTTFHTGYIESAQAVVTLAVVLFSLQQDSDLWPQITGLPHIDTRKLLKRPRNILLLASSDLGYNYAIVVKV